jgi:16S rRNA U516 pseudouridylate synthase RsuA-like enzyme
LRLIRLSISELQLNHLPPGKVKELDQQEFFESLGIPLP